MRAKQFTLTSVKAEAPATLKLRFADGERFALDLSGIIRKHASLKRLKEPDVFSAVQLGAHGTYVAWADDDNLELAADNLRARAIEQAGGISHEFIWNWMAKHRLTLDTAAEALGMSRRMLAYYRSGAKPVPRTVALACIGWEETQDNDARFVLAA